MKPCSDVLPLNKVDINYLWEQAEVGAITYTIQVL